MNEDFWLKKWQEGNIRFHQNKFHPALEKFGERFSPGTILVPLCGKTLDMLFLTSKGHSVIGVELSPIACRDFFLENGIQYHATTNDNFVVFQSEKINLWCGDFFKLPSAVWDDVTAIYDRAALVALPEDMRRSYAMEFSKRMKNNLEILLISFEYTKGAAKSPPFSVPELEIRMLYQDFKVNLIHSEKEEKYTKDHPTLKSIELTQNVYWLLYNKS